MSHTTLVRDRDGDMRTITDTPDHHWRCDGHGWSIGPVEDRIPVPCPICRPHLIGRVGRGRRRIPVLAD